MPLKDPIAHRLYCKTYRLTHTEENRARGQAYYQANREQLLQRFAAYRAFHKVEIAAQQKRFREANAARLAEESHAYYLANSTAIKVKAKAYRQANPDKHQASSNRRRAQKHAHQSETITAAQWQEIKVAYGHRCVYCGRKMQRLTMDHIIPLAKGGTHTLSNIVPACMSCNASKKTGPPPVPVQPLLLTVAPSKPKRRKKAF